MKLNLKNETLMKISLGCLALLAVASLAVDVLSYVDLEQEVSQSQYRLQLSQKLAETSQLNLLINDMHAGRIQEVDEYLNCKLKQNLVVIDCLAVSTETGE